MNHLKITISPVDESLSEMLVALLANEGFEGFEELPNTLIAYVEENNFDTAILETILAPFIVSYTTEIITKTNWNETWESNFQPVIVKDFCTVRADFHELEIKTPFEIVITPKMSFGTGHHATTQQMMSQMKDMNFVGKSDFDFGTGTGILAILAMMLGAENTIAIDNDEWSVMNAKENVERNRVNVEVSIEPIEKFSTMQFDILLANINRNILLQYMNTMSKMTNENGFVLMSGLLTEDQQVIEEAAQKEGLLLIKRTEDLNWISLLFRK
jgi:ribosomal protein L11 methyltransferase